MRLVSLAILAIFPGSAVANDVQDFVQLMKQYRDSINNISCTFSTTTNNKTSVAEYHQRGAFFKLISHGEGKSIQIVTPNQVVTLSDHENQPSRILIDHFKPNRAYGMLDFRVDAGIMIIANDGCHAAIDLPLIKQYNMTVTKQEMEGNPFYKLSYSFNAENVKAKLKLGLIHCTYYFSILHHGALSLAEIISESTTYQQVETTQYKVLKYEEVEPGVFVPIVISSTFEVKKNNTHQIKHKSQSMRELSRVVLHPRLDDRFFEIPFPKGAHVMDLIKGKMFLVQDDGSLGPLIIDGAEQSLAKEEIPVESPLYQQSLQGPTRTEPDDGGFWFIAGGVLLILAALAYWLWQRRRQPDESS